jgi:SRSO17 transposase
MPQSFEKYCSKFDDVFQRDSQREHFRTYLAGLLSESQRKNISVIAANTVGASYFNLHHFIHDSPWSLDELNNRRIDLIWQTRQTRPSPGFKLILDDSGHRKSGNSTEGVGRQYIGQIGKVDNGMVEVTSHIYDGIRGYPLDVAMYKPASNFEKGKEDPGFHSIYIPSPPAIYRRTEKALVD